jgi:hypothetical protein
MLSPLKSKPLGVIIAGANGIVFLRGCVCTKVAVDITVSPLSQAAAILALFPDLSRRTLSA